MNRRLVDVVIVPTLITCVFGFLFMVWAARDAEVQWHAPFSRVWLRSLFGAPVPLWNVLGLVGVAGVICSWAIYSRRKLAECTQARLELMSRNEPAARAHDEKLFLTADSILPEQLLMELLDRLSNDESYERGQRQQLSQFMQFFSTVGSRFIDPQLCKVTTQLLLSLGALLSFLGQHFFRYPRHQMGGDETQFCMHPELNCDREGDGSPDEDVKSHVFEVQLDALVSPVRADYARYRLAIKHSLFR